MTYKLFFEVHALAEWKKLGHNVREEFKKALAKRLEHPRVPAARLHGYQDCYKIKQRASGYRLVYQVKDETITVLVLSVGKRERNAVYNQIDKRI
ncbi:MULTISPECIES: type II toxin-antitoxin system RelE family toxin [Franconibacter]|jgi:mRNA interferase RelE/StbE|uniref:RelE toxin n=1 Tax=Franconibacter pulveris TaxID=435910 RepID=A0A0J8YBV8_9ENTR|nr:MULTISPECIES: type II toxin-antitoxin system RelE/ParE family toxin [Franconibacter]KMV34994.1 RelE toxin [Franconibacter pulveris]MEB5920451.1 type II toxin-antitoxin system RelE/ParE family toxin [Franconibacter daqui]